MKREWTRPEIQFAYQADLLAGILGSHLHTATHFLDSEMWHPSGVHVDHTAHCPGAVDQRAGSLEHLDAVGHQRIHGGGVIRAGHGHVERFQTVLHDADPWSRQAPDYRAPSGIAVRRVVDARLPSEGFGDAAACIARERVAFKYDRGLR